MTTTSFTGTNRRILVIDDNRAIHDDFRKILTAPPDQSSLNDLRAELFGEKVVTPKAPSFEIASAYQGQEGLAAVTESLSRQAPFAMAFVDVRMPPGWDGVETITRIWEVDEEIQIVLCTAYSDYSWIEMMARLGNPDRLVILKKPFDPIEALQLAHALTKKWDLLQATRRKMDELEQIVHQRTLNLKKANDSLQQEIELRKRREHCLTLQQNVTSLLAELAGSSDEITDKLLATLCQSMEWDFAQLWMLDEPAHCLRAVNGWHRPSPGLETFDRVNRQFTFSMGMALPGQVWEAGKPLWIADTLAEKNFFRAESAAKAGLRAAFAFPLRLQGRILAVIEFLSAKIREPEEDLLQVFATMGSLIGQSLERRMLETHLRQSQKMEAIGQLAGGVAHDFNNMLTVIQGFVQILQLQADASKVMSDGLGQIGMAATRAANLTRQLLTFSRKQMIKATTLDLNHLVANVSKMLGRVIGEDIALSLKYSSEPALVSADEDMLTQVLMNLAVNSRDAMPGGGQLAISTELFAITPDDVYSHASGRPGEFVCLSVIDTGCGIAPEILPRIFEPFFTTKEVGRGTGLGLSTVYGIMEQHRGWVEVSSRLGAGTNFRIFLARVEFPTAQINEIYRPADLPEGSETILLVEDEESVRSVARILLRRLGYSVVEAASGKEALDIWKERGNEIDLVLTDMVMPGGVSGRDLARELQRMKPDIKCVLASGYDPFQDDDNHDLIEGVNFLQKPYQTAKLAQTIRKMLDREEMAGKAGR